MFDSCEQKKIPKVALFLKNIYLLIVNKYHDVCTIILIITMGKANFFYSRFLSDLSVHYIGQETTTRSGRGPSSIANEAVGAMSLPASGSSSTIEVQV